MADLSTLTIPVRVTVLESAVLFEMFPDKPRGLSWIVPFEDLQADGEAWKARRD